MFTPAGVGSVPAVTGRTPAMPTELDTEEDTDKHEETLAGGMSTAHSSAISTKDKRMLNVMCGRIRCGRPKNQSQHKGKETTFTPTETGMCTAAQKAGPGNRETKANGHQRLHRPRNPKWINGTARGRKAQQTQRKAGLAGAQRRNLSLRLGRNKKGEDHEKIYVVFIGIISSFMVLC